MPSATASKRVKNKRVERPFIIGSEAWPLEDSNRKPDTPPDHTKGWRVYVRAPDGQPDITRWLKKVQFRIFHTYLNPNRMVEQAPFQIEETGWGGFSVELRLHFVTEAGIKAETRQHFLQLEPYGDEAMQAQQKEAKLVRSEFLDYVEFNEPSETFFDTLTDDNQWGQRPAKGKGKGRSSLSSASDATGTVELPPKSTHVNPFSREMEHGIIEMLKKAEAEVEQQLETEKGKEKKISGELASVRSPARESTT